ncbi:MAG TPA: threonine synthase [Solirubrobacterales bacterium]|jgi:threonine synthase|nr:threonine synthase [Solirubrobacterales bacterium]
MNQRGLSDWGGGGGDLPRTRSCATELVCRDCEERLPLAEAAFRCPSCGKGLDIDYDYELAAARVSEVGLADRPLNLWRFEELMPIAGRAAAERVGQFSGCTPLIRAERLGAELGLRNLYIKDDSTNRPSLSYKDRVVAIAVARALELDKDEIGCVSTGNVGTATASLAAKAGLKPYVFYPANLERAKARSCRALGAQVCELDGNYDEANRACRDLALASGIEFANITLRPFYAEGAKTLAFEVVEQLDWRSPDHIVMPAAGGTLSSRVHKGLNELELVGLAETARTKLHIGQPVGCSPIAKAIVEGSEEIVPQEPETLARSLAIGAPGDGPLVVDAVRSRGGSAAAAADGEIIEAMELLAATEGVLTEPAGGTTVAATMKLAQQGALDPDDTVVVVVSGNGLKTLSEQPVRPWPEMVPCNAATMEEVVMDFRHEGVAARS